MFVSMMWVISFFYLSCFLRVISGQSCNSDSSIPSSWEVILDTYRFEFLIPQRWVALDVDNNGNNFVSFGGVCSRGGYVCSQGVSTENNWVFSEYLQYGSAKEVFFNISYDLTFCGSCANSYFTLYTYNKNSAASATQRTNTSNYQYATGSESTSRFGDRNTGTSIIRAVRPSSFTGFYLAIQDTGTCGEFRRVLVYYKVCPARVSGLVSFPSTPVPARSSGNSVYSGSCALNSHAVTSLMVDINSDTGNCTERASGGARCECDAGYELSGSTSCAACPVGQYRAGNQDHNSCNTCPSNSEATSIGSSICTCLTGYYRTSQETPATGCTQPPGRVRSLAINRVGETYAVISWQNPSNTGERSDYYYSIERTDPQGGVSSVVTVANLVTNGTRTFNVSGLLPFQGYEISVITHNGVSNQEPDTITSRTATITVMTTEGVPGPVTVINLCTAVIWQAPRNPNGNLTGYDIDISNGVTALSPTDFFFVTTTEQQQRNVLARVRARTGAGGGEWSQFSAICPGKCSFSVDVNTTDTTASLRWTRPFDASGNRYNVEVSSNNEETRNSVVTNAASTVTHTLSGLTPFTSYSTTIRMNNASCLKTFVTSEGVSSPPLAFKQFCDVVAWKAPRNPNGNLTGYDIEISNDVISLPPTDCIFLTTTEQQQNNVLARVRATTGAGGGEWSPYSIICPGRCSNSVKVVTATDSKVSLQWTRPSDATGNTYNIVVSSNDSETMNSVFSSALNTVTYTVSGLKPFTLYSSTIQMNNSSCWSTFFETSEGVPSPPMAFEQFCDVVVWKAPRDIQGNLKGYELQFEYSDDTLQTEYLKSTDTFYTTMPDQRKQGVKIRVRANNTNKEGSWTNFFSNGCPTKVASSSSSGILSSASAIDIVIIVVIIAAVCTAIFILVVVLVYVVHKCRSKSSSHDSRNSSDNVIMNDVKLYD